MSIPNPILRYVTQEHLKNIPVLDRSDYLELQKKLKIDDKKFQVRLMFDYADWFDYGWDAIARCESNDGGYILTSFIFVKVEEGKYSIEILDNGNRPVLLENLSADTATRRGKRILKDIASKGYTNRIGDNFFFMIPGRWAQFSFHIYDGNGRTVTKELLEPEGK